MTTTPQTIDIAIIGAGIVGIASAFTLQNAGRHCVVFDRGEMARGASFGNAGAFAFSDVLPMASSGLLRKVPGWLADPLGPLTIPPAYFPHIAPWLLRFWRAGWPDRVKASALAQSSMMKLAAAEMAALVRQAGIEAMVRSDGSLELYESEAEFAAAKPGWDLRAQQNIGFEHVRGARMEELQPGLSPRFVVGTFVPAWQTVTDPYEFVCAIGAAAQQRGTEFRKGEIVGLAPENDGVSLIMADGSRIKARQVLVAAGAWSKPLARRLGDTIPLETERGYNTTLPPSAFDLKRQLTFGGHGFVVTPLSTGLRVGGAVELGGLNLKPNFARADAMLAKAAKFLPGLKTEGGRQWMGFRPSLPDSLPAIGKSRASKNIVYAFGHGHLGLTQSAATARLVEQIMNGYAPAIDIAPFSPQRF